MRADPLGDPGPACESFHRVHDRLLVLPPLSSIAVGLRGGSLSGRLATLGPDQQRQALQSMRALPDRIRLISYPRLGTRHGSPTGAPASTCSTPRRWRQLSSSPKGSLSRSGPTSWRTGRRTFGSTIEFFVSRRATSHDLATGLRLSSAKTRAEVGRVARRKSLDQRPSGIARYRMLGRSLLPVCYPLTSRGSPRSSSPIAGLPLI